MIRFTLTQSRSFLWKRALMSLSLCLMLTLGLNAQSITYGCNCGDDIDDGFILATITVTGTASGETYLIRDVVNLFPIGNTSNPYPDGYQINETPGGSSNYVLTGWVPDDQLATLIIERFSAGGNLTWSDAMAMHTCSRGTFSFAGNDDVCVGSGTETYTLTNDLLTSNLENVQWIVSPSSGAVIYPPSTALNETEADIDWNAPGNYTITVRGDDNNVDCEFEEVLQVVVRDFDAGIAGDTSLCSAQANAGVITYTYSSENLAEDDAIAWTVTEITQASPGNNGIITTMSANNYEITIDFTPVTTEGVYEINASGTSGDCFIDETITVTIVDEYEFGFSEGTTYACEDSDFEPYTLELPSGITLNAGGIWSVIDILNPGSVNVPTIIMGGSPGEVNLDFTTAILDRDYRLELNGSVSPGDCPFTAGLDIYYSANETDAIACNNQVNLSMNLSCEMEFLPSMILQGLDIVDDAYDVILTDENGDELDDNVFTSEHIGMLFQVMVVQKCGDNSCWGHVLVEDKTVPSLAPYCTDVPDLIYECVDLDFNPDLSLNLGFPDFSSNPDITVSYIGGEKWQLDGYDNCGLAELSFEDTADYMCNDSEILITRVWTATDVNSQSSSSCSVEIRVEIAGEDDIIWPPHYDSAVTPVPGTLEACEDSWIPNPDGTPNPVSTGSPEIPLCSKFSITGYTDLILPICGDKAMKILRTWKVFDECNVSNDIEYTQIITIMDNLPPLCAAPEEQTVYADKHSCTIARLEFILPTVEDCSDYTIQAMYKLRDPITGIIPQEFDTLPVGQFYVENIDATADSIWVNFLVEDVCGNKAIDPTATANTAGLGCFYEIAIKDTTQPTPVCDLYSTVSLNANGCAYAWPGTFDDHSIDNCAVYEQVIRRMDADENPCDCEDRYPTFQFADYLGKYNDHHYYLSKHLTTGPKGFAYANAVGAYPVMTGDDAENTWVNSQVRAYTDEPYFIGLSAFAPNTVVPASSYKWNNGSTNTYRNWGQSQPPALLNQGLGDAYVWADVNGEWYAQRENQINGYYVFEVEDPCGWSQEIKFCCEDLNRTEDDPLMVQMRVIDENGNHNFCMVEVDVQDNTPPVINAPANIEVDCTDDIDAIVAAGVATSSALDSVCGVDITMEMSGSTGECGEGTKRVTYTATDAAGNSAQDVWTIRIRNLTPFNGDIDFPKDTTLYATDDFCDISVLEPEDFEPGYDVPTWNSDACSNVTESYDDQVFYQVDEACMKIIRTWTVIDWCQSGKYWTGKQVIKLHDNIAPVITPASCSSESFEGEAFGSDCLVNGGPIVAQATDNCTEEGDLIWSYVLTLEGHGVYTGNTNSISGPFPQGTHRVVWTVEDHCGNVSVPCTKIFTVDDNKAPLAYCLDLVVTSIDPWSEEAVIWAKDLVKLDDSAVACDGDVRYSFSATNLNNTSISLGCDSINNGLTKDTIWLDVYFTDSSGNQSSCYTGIIIQDNSNVCGNAISTRGQIAGHVYTEINRMIENVDVEVSSDNPEFPQKNITLDGGYLFSDVKMYENYNISAAKNDNYLNGVSTLDIVLIQKHILGIQSLDSPYKLIAADANNSESVSAIDLIELRKLILGIYSELPSNDSWRFVDAQYEFPDVISPWPFAENIALNNIEGDYMNADFVGVKIGDVNESADPVLLDGDTQTETRTSENFEIGVREASTGEIQFVASRDLDLIGTQFTLRFNAADIDVKDIVGFKMELNENNINWSLLQDGVLAMSWNQSKAVNVKKGDVLFALIVEKLSNADINFSVVKNPVRSEIYSETNEVLNISNISLRNEIKTFNGFEVYQNTPNPFTNETTIGFRIGQQDDVMIQITNYTGKVLYTESRYFEQGYNEYVIGENLLNTAGILYYQLSTNNQTITRKMVVLK